ncbi:diguanylate cyclase [Xylophilus sp. GW821-FHT01B05]
MPTSRSRTRRLLPWLAVTLTLVIAGLFVAEALYSRHETTERARRSGETLTNTIEENIHRTLEFYERSLVGVVRGAADPAAMALPPALRNRVLFDSATAVPGVSLVYVLDARGTLVLSSGSLNPKPHDLSQRSYFQVHQRRSDVGLYISEPIVPLTEDGRVVVLSMRLQDKDGVFQGVAAVTIRARYFAALFDLANIGPQGRITLLRKDGTALSRFPYDPAIVGSNMAPLPAVKRFLETGDSFFRLPSVFDSETRLYQFKSFDVYPLIVAVAQSSDVVYAEWRRRVLVLGGITLVLMLACLGLGALFVRELDARQRTALRLRDAERDLRAILNGLPSMVAYWDRHLQIRFANDSYLSGFAGGAPSDANGDGSQQLSGANLPYLERALQGERQAFETPVIDSAGVRRHLLVSFVPDPDPDHEGGGVRGVFVQATDLTERKAAEDQQAEEKERMRVTLASIGDAVISTDRDGRITYLNPVAERMTGWHTHEALQHDIDEVVPLHEGAADGPARSPIRDALRQRRIVVAATSGVLVNRWRQCFDVEDCAAPIEDGNGEPVGAVMVLRDVTATRAMARRMAHLAHYDALTELPNRVLLQDRAQQAIAHARRHGGHLALMYLDLDGFKHINDSLGHDVGDALLVQFAQRLKAALRQSDTLSRQGGDEFVVLAPQAGTPEAAQKLAGELVRLAAIPFLIGERSLQVTTSLGIALFPDDGDSLEELARHADAAMYAAKRGGRNRVHFYTGEIGAQADQQFRSAHLPDGPVPLA